MLDCEKFQPAEWICRAYWKFKGYQYMNLTKNEQYFDDDIDFFVFRDDMEKEISVEVKGSNYARSLYVETEVYNKTSGTKVDGWFYKCRAEWLFVVDMRCGYISAFTLEALRQYIITKPTREATHEDKKQRTRGRIVYIDDLIQCGVQVSEINLDKVLK